MGKPSRARIGARWTVGWLGIFAVAAIAVVGALGPDDAAIEITDETAASCLACVALGSDGLEQLASAHRLTPREMQISRHVAFGWKNHDIANHLGTSVRTIESHLHHVYAKLGVHNRVQLALLMRSATEP